MRYRSTKTFCDGVEFDSKMEAQVFRELKLELGAKGITKLALQPRFELVVNGVKVGHYTSDFLYYDTDGTQVVVEVKGYATPVYRLRVKVFKALYPEIRFHEITKIPRARRRKAKSRDD